jgi:hypothetical protein
MAAEDWIDTSYQPYESDTRDYEWEDKNYHVSLVRDLETSHIENIIKAIDRGIYLYAQDWKRDYLVKELRRRELARNELGDK